MKRIIKLTFALGLSLLFTLPTFSQTVEARAIEPIPADKNKVLRSLAFSFGGGYNPTVSRGNYASYITLDYPIVKRSDFAIVVQLARYDANNARETPFGPNYEGIPNAPANANQKSFFNNQLSTITLGYHKRLGNRASIGLNGGLGINQSVEDYELIIPYTQGTGFNTNVNFRAKRRHNFLGYAIGTDFRYGLGKYVAFQAQIVAIKNATDLSIQVPVLVGFSFQFR
jgi:hypothetical protein